MTYLRPETVQSVAADAAKSMDIRELQRFHEDLYKAGANMLYSTHDEMIITAPDDPEKLKKIADIVSAFHIRQAMKNPTVFEEVKPRHQHDCSKCIFLGRFEPGGSDHEKYDLYFCEKGPGPTVIARFGSEPSHNLSGLIVARSIRKRDPDSRFPIVEALRRAESRGFLWKEEP